MIWRSTLRKTKLCNVKKNYAILQKNDEMEERKRAHKYEII